MIRESFLQKHYVRKKKSMQTIAQELGCDYALVDYYMRKYQIPRRSRSKAQLLFSNHVILSNKARGFLIGELLGDGHLTNNGPFSSFYYHGSKYLEYLVWLSGIFGGFEIEQSGKINKDLKTGCFFYASRSYPELKTLQKKWYRPTTEEERKRQRKFIKILPKNLFLTPLVCRQWYIGDGYLGPSGRYTNYVAFCTQSFTEEEVCLLVSLLRSLGFKATMHADRSIYISTYSTKDFLKYIGPCPKEIENIYGYKWGLENIYSEIRVKK